MMAALRIFLISMLLMLAGPTAGAETEPEGQAQNLPTATIFVESAGAAHAFEVQLATTWQQQRTGLMFRTEMADDQGMLFLYRFTQRLSFWMKNTYIPLDLIFIKADGTISEIAPNATPLSLESIESRERVRAVLEINGGLAEKLGIREGDMVRFDYFKNVPGEGE